MNTYEKKYDDLNFCDYQPDFDIISKMIDLLFQKEIYKNDKLYFENQYNSGENKKEYCHPLKEFFENLNENDLIKYISELWKKYSESNNIKEYDTKNVDNYFNYQDESQNMNYKEYLSEIIKRNELATEKLMLNLVMKYLKETRKHENKTDLEWESAAKKIVKKYQKKSPNKKQKDVETKRKQKKEQKELKEYL